MEDQRETSKNQELSRLITLEGTVIKQMKDGSSQILFRNGNFWSTKKRGVWQVNSNSGFKLQNQLLSSIDSPMKDSSAFDFSETAVDLKLDPKTGNKVYRRIDQVITTISPTGSTLVKHADSTLMKTFVHSKNEIHQLIENPEGFASVLLRHDTQKQRQWSKQSGVTTIGQGGTAASQGDTDIMERSVDGNLIVVTAPNNSAVATGHKERRELPGIDNYYDVFVWTVKMEDGSAIKIEEDGEVVFIAAAERRKLNDQSENRKNYGEDVAYHLQLFSPKDERKVGVYTCELNKNILWTFDNERNYFELNSNGKVTQRIAISFIQNDPFAELTPRFKTPEYIDQENLFLPAPDNWIPPRLFVLNNDNTGYEILSEGQLEHEFHIKGLDKNMNLQIKELQNFELKSYFKQLRDEMAKPIYNLAKELPQIVNELPQTRSQNKKQKKRVYIQKNYQKFPKYDEHQRMIYATDLKQYEQAMANFQKQKASYSIMQKAESQSEKENVSLQLFQLIQKEQQVQQRIEQLMIQKTGSGESASQIQELEMSSELSYIQ